MDPMRDWLDLLAIIHYSTQTRQATMTQLPPLLQQVILFFTCFHALGRKEKITYFYTIFSLVCYFVLLFK